ncbi:hypothetical protein Vafri_5076 [Volvox africanus]|uniref:enoyl-[acyl-carrier-protein] reductase n=1 Tax=Volvox africanus TaxID=51714 RepID=A0A8J4EWN4_9CHLO|nr:hypothetical protein Vafri_5076 [Volvox africanus]
MSSGALAAAAARPPEELHPRSAANGGPGVGRGVPAAATLGGPSSGDLYLQLGLSRGATDTEIRRTYRNLLTRAHPDKGGDPERFRRIQAAYDVLSDPAKRKLYDQTGRVQRTADQEFVERFANGAFNDPLLSTADGAAGGGGGSLADQIIVRHSAGEAHSHTAGFEAWMRSRGDAGGKVFTAETVAEQYGVARQSYDPVLLPTAAVLQVLCRGPGGNVAESLSLESVPLVPELEWGQVLVAVKYAPINAADTYTARLGGVYGNDTAPKLPYVAGHDGVGVVLKVGPGVKSLSEGDPVLPLRPFAGTWATAAVWQEHTLLKLPKDVWGLPLEYLAMSRELVVAYQLLEQGGLKPGDAVILNAASSTVGQTVLQLARLLRLRAIAIVRRQPVPVPVSGEASDATDEDASSKWDRTVTWLRSLGAAEVLADEGSLRSELDRLRFFARPRLALDAVGGDSALRLLDALAEGGEMVVYGCMSGHSPSWPWHSWVFRDLRVRGFNLRRWAAARPTRLAEALEALAKLFVAGMLSVAYTEYDITEWQEALEHAQERGKQTKVLLKLSDSWVSTDAMTPSVAAAQPLRNVTASSTGHEVLPQNLTTRGGFGAFGSPVAVSTTLEAGPLQEGFEFRTKAPPLLGVPEDLSRPLVVSMAEVRSP